MGATSSRTRTSPSSTLDPGSCGWPTRRLRSGRRGHGRRQEGRVVRISEREDEQEDCDRGLWAVLNPGSVSGSGSGIFTNPISGSTTQSELQFHPGPVAGLIALSALNSFKVSIPTQTRYEKTKLTFSSIKDLLIILNYY